MDTIKGIPLEKEKQTATLNKHRGGQEQIQTPKQYNNTKIKASKENKFPDPNSIPRINKHGKIFNLAKLHFQLTTFINFQIKHS
jgi:hypothetical protein